MVKKRKKKKKLKKKKRKARKRSSRSLSYKEPTRLEREQKYLDNRWGGKEGIPIQVFLIPALIFGLITWGMWQIKFEYGVWTMIISFGLWYYIIHSYTTDKKGRGYRIGW